MANRTKTFALVLGFLAVFLAGGWFFSTIALRMQGGEVADMYTEDGESVGIFDNIPAEDLAEGQQIAQQGLAQEIVLPEDSATSMEHAASLPTQIAVTEWGDIAGIVSKAETEEKSQPGEVRKSDGVQLDLQGNEVLAIPQQDYASLPDRASAITMITAPVKFFLIKNTEDYKAFKTRARGAYPTVDFAKQMLVVLESDSNLPDKVFEIQSAGMQEGKLLVTYRVNVLGLKQKTNTHTVAAVDKTAAEVELKQVR